MWCWKRWQLPLIQLMLVKNPQSECTWGRGVGGGGEVGVAQGLETWSGCWEIMNTAIICNACRAQTGRFPIRIEAQCKNFKFWLTLTKNENKLSLIAYSDIKWNEKKAFWSKKIKSLLEQIGLGEFWKKAQYAKTGIVNVIRQWLKDIELQRWLSKVNNDTREDANQSNKMRT